MTADPTMVGMDESAMEALGLMLRNKTRHLPVRCKATKKQSKRHPNFVVVPHALRGFSRFWSAPLFSGASDAVSTLLVLLCTATPVLPLTPRKLSPKWESSPNSPKRVEGGQWRFGII